MSSLLVIEMVGRLPGPMAASLLVAQEVDVIKIEDASKPDPFSSTVDEYISPMFNKWYETLSRGKTLFKLSNPSHENMSPIFSKLKNYKEITIIAGENDSTLKNYVEEIKLQANNLDIPWLQINIASDVEGNPIHDLDMAAMVGLLNTKNKVPLKYPVIGMQFANILALKCLCLPKNKK